MNLTKNEILDDVVVPQSAMAVWAERFLWLFFIAFAFDYQAGESREAAGGAGVVQMIFLATAFAATMATLAIGWRTLLVRPGVWLIMLWAGYLGFNLINSVLQNVPFSRSLRVMLPFILCLFGLLHAHVASCMGVSAARILRPVFFVACFNVLWRLFFGFGFQGYQLDTVRFELQSPGSNFLAAMIPCILVLRGKFHWSLIVACLVLFAGIYVSITRALLFPIMTSCLVSAACFIVGTRWGIFSMHDWIKRSWQMGAAVLFGIAVVVLAALMLPQVSERWINRLFFDAATRNTTVDVSLLTRKAEAVGIKKSLQQDPVHWIHGKGMGASYDWDLSYLPEIYLVIPKVDEPHGTDQWFAGHSTWTYAVFSGGVIGLTATVCFFGSIVILSLKAARANASDPGPMIWLAFLPCIVVLSMMSETLTSNPLHERLAGMILGVMAGLSQSFFIRSSWIHRMPLRGKEIS